MCPRCGEKTRISKSKFRDTKYFLYVCNVCGDEWIDEDKMPKMSIDFNNYREDNLL